MKRQGFLFTPKPAFGELTVRGKKIVRLSSRKTPKKIERLILPGFISTHIHTVQTHARNTAENLELLDWLTKKIWPFEAKLNPMSAYLSALDGMNECLEFGITTILDMATSRHTHSVFQAARDSGIRAFIGKALMDQGPKSLIDPHPLDELYDLLSEWHGAESNRLHVTLCPRFALSCSEKLLRQIGRISNDLNLLHHTHASENKKECDWIKTNYGLSNIEFLDKMGTLNDKSIIAHGVHLSSRDLSILKKRKSSISHCPASNLKLASGIADIKRMNSINLSLGVDGAACNNLLDPFFEMRLAHLLSRSLHGLKGVSAKQIFQMATLGGAKALCQEQNLGSLELNKYADLVVVKIPSRIRFNPEFAYESLIHSITAADIESVVVAGREVFRN